MVFVFILSKEIKLNSNHKYKSKIPLSWGLPKASAFHLQTQGGSYPTLWARTTLLPSLRLLSFAPFPQAPVPGLLPPTATVQITFPFFHDQPVFPC